MKIRKNDTVLVISGKDKGKKGKVRFAYPKEGKLIVEGVNFVKKHAKAKGQAKQAGIIELEARLNIGNVMLLVLNLPLIGMWVKVLKVPYKILFPLIILFCLIGSYSVNFRVIDMVVMLAFGGIGYLMKKYQYDGGPLILAFILGPLLETALRQSLIISHGGLDIFVKRPLALGALLIALAFLLFPLIPAIGKKREKLVDAE